MKKAKPFLLLPLLAALPLLLGAGLLLWKLPVLGDWVLAAAKVGLIP